MVNRTLITFLIVSLSLNGLFGYVSYAFYGQKVKAEQSLSLCQEANKTLENSVKRQQSLCKIQDAVVSEYKEEQKEHRDKTQDYLDKLDRMSHKEEQHELHSQSILDRKLPDDLVRMLSENCLYSKGRACTNP